MSQFLDFPICQECFSPGFPGRFPQAIDHLSRTASHIEHVLLSRTEINRISCATPRTECIESSLRSRGTRNNQAALLAAPGQIPHSWLTSSFHMTSEPQYLHAANLQVSDPQSRHFLMMFFVVSNTTSHNNNGAERALTRSSRVVSHQLVLMRIQCPLA